MPSMHTELEALALDLTWTWEPRISRVFEALDPVQWEEGGHNPILLLERLGDAGVGRALGRPGVREALEAALRARREHLERPAALDEGGTPLIAYFSMEFGLTEVLPIYSGGLGILAGDHLKAAADLRLPLVGVGLLYRRGFGRQRIDEAGQQYEVFPENDFERLPLRRAVDMTGQPVDVTCPIGERTLTLAVWRAQVGSVPLLLLDSDTDANPPELRTVTDQLYASEAERRLPQEIALGVGGVRALRAMGYAPSVFHMNEGHGFLVAIERVREVRASEDPGLDEAIVRAKRGMVFTTHTPVAAGSDYFDGALLDRYIGTYLASFGFPLDTLLRLGRRQPDDPGEPLCTTYVGLRLAARTVGVSQLHGTVSRRLWHDAWPGIPEEEVPIGAVTNGVHLPTWVAPEIAALLRDYVAPDWWDLEPDDERWNGVERIPAAELWARHSALRRRLLGFAAQRGGAQGLDPEALTIGFTRRFAAYKRANLLLSDRERLHRLLHQPGRPMQLIVSGKAHPADAAGKEILHEVVEACRHEPHIAFLPDYDIEVARPVVQGSDVWLNNPRRFLEASGTSGMKAAANGGLNLSVLDGWWDEAYTPEVGWAIPSYAVLGEREPDDLAEAARLYELLELQVVPLFYDRDGAGIPQGWVHRMRQSIRRLAGPFSARRMVIEYERTCYEPSLRVAAEAEAEPV